MKTTTLEIPGNRGITDLYGLFAFVGNSQGDESATNSIERYMESGGWMSFVFDCPMTDEAIAGEVRRRKNWNDAYVQKLQQEGTYGQEYTSTLEIVHSPAFDDKPDSSGPPLSSYQMIIFDP